MLREWETSRTDWTVRSSFYSSKHLRTRPLKRSSVKPRSRELFFRLLDTRDNLSTDVREQPKIHLQHSAVRLRLRPSIQDQFPHRRVCGSQMIRDQTTSQIVLTETTSEQATFPDRRFKKRMPDSFDSKPCIGRVSSRTDIERVAQRESFNTAHVYDLA